MAQEKVGFVGLGIMGKPMAKNLIKAGHELVVYSRSGSADELTDYGAGTADSYKAIAEECDIVITCLPAGPQVEEVYLGEEGLLAGAGEGSLLIDMSTISPLVTKEIAQKADEKGVRTLDSPISGGEPGSGELNYRYIFTALADLPYDGWVGLEYKPTTESTEESFGWLPKEKRGGDVGVEDLNL